MHKEEFPGRARKIISSFTNVQLKVGGSNLLKGKGMQIRDALLKLSIVNYYLPHCLSTVLKS